jgi:integrase
MPVEMRRQRDGRLREHWYGRYEVNGRLHYVNLDIKIAGSPPASIRDLGDGPFERSRAAAQAKLDQIIREARSTENSARLVEQLYEIKTGEAIKTVKLDELAEEWAKIPRRREPDERYASQCQSTLRRFVEFVRKENRKAEELAHVNRAVARSFMDAEMKRGVSPKTWNDTLKLLRATFKYLLPAGAINPFSDTPTKDTETVFRIPFTPEELKAIVVVSRNDEFIRPIIITGMCSAMRRGDCCLLKGEDVDMKHRFITVKTAKTGVTVSIPIFPMLYDELAKRTLKPGKYVFPEQAEMYLENPDGITWRVKKVLALALREDGDDPEDEDTLPEVSAEELRRRGHKYLATLPDSPKKEHMRTVFDLYASGKRMCDAVAASGVSKGSASNYLNQIEGAIGCRVVRGRDASRSVTALLKDDKGVLGAKRDGGQRRASLRDFHSFRVTWVTLALTAGVPLELVQKVTGHKTTDIVLKHYFQPGREAFRTALNAAMPQFLTYGKKSPQDEARAILDGMTGKTSKQDKARLLKLMAKM